MALRQAPLCSGAAFHARLVHYPPRLRHEEHEHVRAQLSFLLLGEAREIVGQREAEVSVAARGVKPAGIRHAAEFGRNGALMLTFDFSAGTQPDILDWSEPCRWRRLSPAVLRLISAALGSAEQDRADMLWDVLAAPGTEGPDGRAPAWLREARERIADAPGDTAIGAIAKAAGVHRVHFSRAFQAAFGIAPSLYRNRCMAARSLNHVVKKAETLADAATAAGFADQSHMTRAFRAHIGLSPARMRAALGG